MSLNGMLAMAMGYAAMMIRNDTFKYDRGSYKYFKYYSRNK